jgi:hypothetical protein
MDQGENRAVALSVIASEAFQLIVMPREGGASSIHEAHVVRDGGVYWITRLRG